MKEFSSQRPLAAKCNKMHLLDPQKMNSFQNESEHFHIQNFLISCLAKTENSPNMLTYAQSYVLQNLAVLTMCDHSAMSV